jgi:hypothetical protein
MLSLSDQQYQDLELIRKSLQPGNLWVADRSNMRQLSEGPATVQILIDRGVLLPIDGSRLLYHFVEMDKPAELVDPSTYGVNFQRDEWLFANRSKMTLGQLHDALKLKSKREHWTVISTRQIPVAIKNFAAHFKKSVPRGKAGRPRKKT